MLSNQWHHVVACADDESKQSLGRRESRSQAGRRPVRSAPAMRRCGSEHRARTGSPSVLLDADIAMPAIYAQSAFGRRDQGAIRIEGSGAADRSGSCSAAGRSMRSEAIGPPTPSPHGRDAQIINHGTWMIGGPSFQSRRAACRSVRPRQRPDSRPWPAAGLRRSFRLPVESLARIFACPSTHDPAFMRHVFIFRMTAKNGCITAVFIVKKARCSPQGSDRVSLFDQHLAGLRSDAVLGDLERAQEVDRQQRLREQPRRSAGVLPLSPAPCGAGDLLHRSPNALADRRARIP